MPSYKKGKYVLFKLSSQTKYEMILGGVKGSFYEKIAYQARQCSNLKFIGAVSFAKISSFYKKAKIVRDVVIYMERGDFKNTNFCFFALVVLIKKINV